MKNTIAASILFAASVAPAWATDQGFFVAVDAGAASFTNAPSAINCIPCAIFGIDKFGASGATGIGGGYHYNRNWGVEVAYTRIDDSTNSEISGSDSATETLNGSSFGAAAVGTYPLSESFDVFAKLGLARTTLKYQRDLNVGGVPTSGSASGTKVNLVYGLGLQYNFNEQWGLRLQYLNLGSIQVGSAGDAYDSNIGVHVYSLGGVYNF